MGGSVQAMMRAAGFTNEKDFFKAIEAGKILTKDVLPKFSQELRKMSREGGALDKTMNSTPAQFARFMAAVTNAKLAFYDNGYDEGLGYFFREFTTIIQSLNPLMITLGKVFKGAMMSVTFALKAIAVPFQFVIKLFENFGEVLESLGLKDAGGVIWTLVGGAGGGVLLMMAAKFGIVAQAVKILNGALLTTLSRLAPFIAAYAAIEDVFLYMKHGDNADTVTGSAINFLKENNIKKNNPLLYGSMLSSGSMQQNFFAYQLDKAWQDLKIVIEPNGEGFDKIFSAKLEKNNQARTAATQSEVSQ